MKRLQLIATTLFLTTIFAGCGETQTNDTPKAEVSSVSLGNPTLQFETTMGNFTVQLNREKAPITVDNFIDYVEADFYSDTIFHRVIDGFMIQGGGFTQDMTQKTTEAPIVIEADNGLLNKRGTIAMARTAAPNSATSQFFINVVDNPALDHQSPTAAGWGYAVFGEVIDGMDVVDAIRQVKTGRNGMHRDVPLEPIVILQVEQLDTASSQ